MERKIELGSDVFKALSSDTRMEILRKLDSRRMTVTELSKAVDVSKSTVHEHLSKLSEAGLTSKVDSDNKWVYYELTDKGNEILHPRERTKIVLFVASILASGIGAFFELQRSIKSGLYSRAPKAMATMEKGQETALEEKGVSWMSGISWIDLALAVMLLAISIYLVYRLWNYLEPER